jgi:hypothetical protein
VQPDGQPEKPDGRSLTRVGSHAHVVLGTTRRRFAYQWSRPRSTAARILQLPLLVAASLITLLIVALALAFLLAAVALGALLVSVAALLRLAAPRPRRR